MTLPNPPGHQIIAPGQTIGSSWGNAVWGQSTERYASVADRDTQLISPQDGTVCYTLAEQRLWLRQAGKWVPQMHFVDTVNNELAPPKTVVVPILTVTGNAGGRFTLNMSGFFTQVLTFHFVAANTDNCIVFSAIDYTPVNFTVRATFVNAGGAAGQPVVGAFNISGTIMGLSI